MKIIIIILTFLLLYSNVNIAQEVFWDEKVFSETDIVPARIEIYEIGSTSFYFLRPIDISQFTYLSYYPLTAYMFCMKMNEEKILDITVKELKSGFFNGYTNETSYSEEALVYNLNYIKGFEEDAKILANMDEFEIADKKAEFQSKLLECWQKYNLEFENRYLNRSYSILPHFKKYKEGYKLNEYSGEGNTSMRFEMISIFFRSEKNDYDFDDQYLNIDYPFFSQHSFPFTDRALDEKKYLRFKKVYLPLGVIKTYNLMEVGDFPYVYMFIVSPTRQISKYNYYAAHYHLYNEFDIKSIDLIFCSTISPYKVSTKYNSFKYPDDIKHTINLYSKY